MHKYVSIFYDKIKAQLMEICDYSENMEIDVFYNDLGKQEFYIKDCLDDKTKILTCVDSKFILKMEIDCLLELKNEKLKKCGR